LSTDPIGRQGHTGKILAADENAITVIFDDSKTGDYAPDGLLILLPKDAILRDLIATNNIIAQQDCKLALRICSLLSDKRYDEALKLAITNDTTRTLCTINCEAWVQRKHMKKNKMATTL
jgi:hypothetical protein